MVQKYFPDRISPSSAVLVVDAGTGGDVTQGEAGGVRGRTHRLVDCGSDAPAAVDRVLSPTFGDEMTRAGLTSADKQVALVLVRFSTIGTEPVTKEAIAAIEAAARAGPLVACRST